MKTQDIVKEELVASTKTTTVILYDTLDEVVAGLDPQLIVDVMNNYILTTARSKGQQVPRKA